MKRLNFMVPEDLYDWIYEERERRDISAAEVMRQALSAWRKLRSDPLIQFDERHFPEIEHDELRAVDAGMVGPVDLLRRISNQLDLMMWSQPEETVDRMLEKLDKQKKLYRHVERPDSE